MTVVDAAGLYTLDGKTVIVTGSGGGIGRGIALGMARAGASVILAVRRLETGEAVAAEISAAGGEAVAVRCDVTTQEDVDRAVEVALERFGRLNAVVHNATYTGAGIATDLESADVSEWERQTAVNVGGTVHCAHAAHPHLASSAGAYLVLVSTAGIEGSPQARPFYAMDKGAQRALVKSLAREWGPDGIRVNSLAPMAMTPALDEAIVANPALEATLEALAPLGRIGDPERDIAPAATFLCSDASRYITGQTLIVNGGRFTAL